MVEPVDTWLKEKINEVAKLQKEIETYQELKIQFPDLSYSIDRWKHFRLHSKCVDEIATDVDIRHSCGCCSDSPLFARPYIIVGGVQIFSCETFTIGEKAYNGGDHPLPGWRTKLLNAKLPQEIVDRVEAYFGISKPSECENDDDVEPII